MIDYAKRDRFSELSGAKVWGLGAAAYAAPLALVCYLPSLWAAASGRLGAPEGLVGALAFIALCLIAVGAIIGLIVSLAFPMHALENRELSGEQRTFWLVAMTMCCGPPAFILYWHLYILRPHRRRR